MRTRSMFVLLNAEAIVKPPMSNIIVGENITENMNLQSNTCQGINDMRMDDLTLWHPG